MPKVLFQCHGEMNRPFQPNPLPNGFQRDTDLSEEHHDTESRDETKRTTVSYTDIKSESDPDFEMIKKEEPLDEPLDRTLPVLDDQNDMFDDVDELENVDQTYEGIAEVDGVDYFICEGEDIVTVSLTLIHKH